MKENKIVVLKTPSYTKSLRSLLSETSAEIYSLSKFEQLEDRPSVDFTFIEKEEDVAQADGRIVLLCAPGDYKKHFEDKVEAVVCPKTLEHEVGLTLLKRLIGENSSLGMQNAYSEGDTKFKSFRLMDHLSMGHYSDVLAQAANRFGFSALNIRTYTDSIVGLLGLLKGKVELPYDVDFGVWKDVFVIQLHASCKNIFREDFLSSMGNYDVIDSRSGLLKQALSQVDALDIFTLERSERIVLTAQWFHPDFKRDANFYPTLYLHEIPKFEQFQDRPLQNTVEVSEDLVVPKGQRARDELEKVMLKVESMDFSDFYQMVHGTKSDEGLEIERVKGVLNVPDEEFWVRGEREDIGERAQEIWRIKRSEIVEDLKERQFVAGDGRGDFLFADQEVTHVIKSQLDLRDEHVRYVVQGLLRNDKTGDYAQQMLKQRIIRQEAQIKKMRKLMDRMKNELFEKRYKNAGQIHNHEQDLVNQLSVAQKRLSQMSERMSQEKGENENREKTKVKRLRSLEAEAQKKIHQLQKDLAESEKKVLQKENERIVLAEKIKTFEMITPDAKQEDKSLENEIEKLKRQNNDVKEKERRFNLNLKKLEQKNRYLRAQLDASSKKEAEDESSMLGISGKDKKLKYYERIIEKMKETETNYQADLEEKSNQVFKLRNEVESHKNKIAELERKLQKYQKKAA